MIINIILFVSVALLVFMFVDEIHFRSFLRKVRKESEEHYKINKIEISENRVALLEIIKPEIYRKLEPDYESTSAFRDIKTAYIPFASITLFDLKHNCSATLKVNICDLRNRNTKDKHIEIISSVESGKIKNDLLIELHSSLDKACYEKIIFKDYK